MGLDSLQILLVEDDALVARGIERELRARGCSVTRAPSATTALASTGPFDVGVFDIYLPDGLGLEVAERLLAASRVATAVFYSATADERMWVRAEGRGVFVHKREGIRRLIEVIEEQRELRS